MLRSCQPTSLPVYEPRRKCYVIAFGQANPDNLGVCQAQDWN
jgi:hypothetical protein